MPNFSRCYQLWRQCSGAVCYVGNTYMPAWMDDGPGLRHDAHLHTTMDLLRPIIRIYGEIASGEAGLQ